MIPVLMTKATCKALVLVSAKKPKHPQVLLKLLTYVRRNHVQMVTLWSPVDLPCGRCDTSREQRAMLCLLLKMRWFLEMVSTGRQSLELGRSPSQLAMG